MPTQPHNYFKHFLLPFPSFLFYNNIIIPSLNSPFEAFEPYTFAVFATFTFFIPSAFKLEATKASSFTKSSSDREANDTFISEVFFSTNKYSLTIWAVMYVNIE